MFRAHYQRASGSRSWLLGIAAVGALAATAILPGSTTTRTAFETKPYQARHLVATGTGQREEPRTAGDLKFLTGTVGGTSGDPDWTLSSGTGTRSTSRHVASIAQACLSCGTWIPNQGTMMMEIARSGGFCTNARVRLHSQPRPSFQLSRRRHQEPIPVMLTGSQAVPGQSGLQCGLGPRGGLSRWEESTTAFRDAIALYHDLGDRLEEARAQVRHALVFRDQHLSSQAITLITAGLETVRQLGDRRWEARAMRQLAIVHRNDGDMGTAITLLSECLDILGELEDRRGVAVACATAVMPTGWLGGSMMPGMIWPVR